MTTGGLRDAGKIWGAHGSPSTLLIFAAHLQGTSVTSCRQAAFFINAQTKENDVLAINIQTPLQLISYKVPLQQT